MFDSDIVWEYNNYSKICFRARRNSSPAVMSFKLRVREPSWLNRSDSDTDGIVRMKEHRLGFFPIMCMRLESNFKAFLLPDRFLNISLSYAGQ